MPTRLSALIIPLRSTIAFVCALFGTTLAAQAVPAAQGPVVIVYSDRHQVEDRAIFNAFTKETGIRVILLDQERDQLLERLKSERAAPHADLVISVGIVQLTKLDSEHLLRDIDDKIPYQTVPDYLRAANNHWVGLASWARIIAYDKSAIEVPPARYEDLAAPQFKGQLLVRSATSPYNQALVAAILASDGPEKTEAWAHNLVENFARPPQGGDTNQLMALQQGDGHLAVINTRYWARYAASSKITDREIVDNLGLVFPNQADRGTQIDLVGAGLIDKSPHKAEAQRLLGYLLQMPVIEKFASANFEYPTRIDAKPDPILAGLGPFKIDQHGLHALMTDLGEDARRIMAKAGWE